LIDVTGRASDASSPKSNAYGSVGNTP
jgi:hypothetical protein